MILEIRLRNFFSIKDEVVLDLRAGNINTQKAKELTDNVFAFTKEKVLKSVAIFGANASGKSNIVKAIRFCCMMILDSHQHNEGVTFNFKPFKFDGYSDQPSQFFIRFVHEEIEYEYAYSLTTTAILTESLYHYPNQRKKKLFTRDETIKGDKKDKYSFAHDLNRPFDVAENTSQKTLFLSRASQLDREWAKSLYRFFNQYFLLRFANREVAFMEHQLTHHKATLLRALQIADSDIIDFRYWKEKIKLKQLTFSFGSDISATGGEDTDGEVLKIQTFHRSDPDVAFDFESEESEGTKKLFLSLLSIIDIIQSNKTLLIDELDIHLHTRLVDFILELFHNSEGAQLIFTSHNTNLLDLNKLRRDQIYFVNKNSEGASELYSLFDFKDFRENMDAEKGYLQGRFDAVPYIDDSNSSLQTLIHGEETTTQK